MPAFTRDIIFNARVIIALSRRGDASHREIARHVSFAQNEKSQCYLRQVYLHISTLRLCAIP